MHLGVDELVWAYWWSPGGGAWGAEPGQHGRVAAIWGGLGSGCCVSWPGLFPRSWELESGDSLVRVASLFLTSGSGKRQAEEISSQGSGRQ